MAAYLRFLLLFAISAALGGLSSSRQVKLDKPNGCNESRLWVWGQMSASSPASFQGGCGVTSIDIGTVSEKSHGNQVVAFTLDRPPAIGLRMKWNDPGPFTITYPSVYELPVKFWVLCKANCVFSTMKTDLALAVTWANDVLESERTGIYLDRKTGDAWISDQTAVTAPADPVVQFRNFYYTSGTHGCGEQGLAALATKLSPSQAINIVVVDTVNNSITKGYTCNNAPASWASPYVAFVAAGVGEGTILHEIGHMFYLAHTDTNPALKKDKENVMHPASSERAFFTEGQVFQMNFTAESILNKTFQKRITEQRNCDDSGVSADLPCPATEARLWYEK